jgi:acetyltransferase-like isoleucine patch superfamily enzyme
MNLQILGGSLLAFGYNHFIGHIPSRKLRKIYLHCWLGALGQGTCVQKDCLFLNGRRVSFGARNVINFGCMFDGRKFNVRIGDDVSIGPEASILTLGHDPQSLDFADRGGDVVIGDRAWIGYRAIILPGINIGEGAVVGAGAVVTKDVPAFSIVAGNPARIIGRRNSNLTYQLNYQPFLV